MVNTVVISDLMPNARITKNKVSARTPGDDSRPDQSPDFAGVLASMVTPPVHSSSLDLSGKTPAPTLIQPQAVKTAGRPRQNPVPLIPGQAHHDKASANHPADSLPVTTGTPRQAPLLSFTHTLPGVVEHTVSADRHSTKSLISPDAMMHDRATHRAARSFQHPLAHTIRRDRSSQAPIDPTGHTSHISTGHVRNTTEHLRTTADHSRTQASIVNSPATLFKNDSPSMSYRIPSFDTTLQTPSGLETPGTSSVTHTITSPPFPDFIMNVGIGRAPVSPSVHHAMHSAHWAPEFSQQCVSLIRSQGNGSHRAELRLDPPELGPLRISLHINDSMVQAVFTSPHASVRQAVEHALPQLQQHLEQEGLSLGQASVDQDRNFSDSKQEQSGHYGRTMPTPPAGELSTPLETHTRPRIADALIDTFA